MTDTDELFSEPVKPCRRNIQVGGEKIWSDGIGTATIKLDSGRRVFLEDSLRVPGLDVRSSQPRDCQALSSLIGELMRTVYIVFYRRTGSLYYFIEFQYLSCYSYTTIQPLL